MDRHVPAVPRPLRLRAAAILDDHWRPDGYTSPNLTTYPWQWLWDSCFHALVWAALGRPERSLAELDAALAPIDADGFVPHMRYQSDPTVRADFWGRPGTSSITQPPMFGHALAELHRGGVDLPAVVLERATAAFRFLLERRDRTGGLVAVVHPWETGCDDSPRWDHWSPGPYDRTGFRAVKGDLVTTIRRTVAGSPVGNDAFAPGSIGFNALVAFNARELAAVTGDALAHRGGGHVGRHDRPAMGPRSSHLDRHRSARVGQRAHPHRGRAPAGPRRRRPGGRRGRLRHLGRS